MRLTPAKSLYFLWLVLAGFLVSFAGRMSAETPSVSETDKRIQTLQERAKLPSADFAVYDELGLAYLQKARETGDFAYFNLAEKSLTKCLSAVPNDFHAADPLVHMALLYMGEHNFTSALSYSQKAIALGAGNLPAFAIEGDAYTDMGKYDDAAAAYNSLRTLGAAVSSPTRLAYMLDSRMAYLSFLHGDAAEADRLLESAIAAGLQTNVPRENLAWLYFELGERYFQEGELTKAAMSYQSGLAADPNHYRSLAGLGKVRAAQGNYDEAIRLYQRSLDIVPFPQYVEELGDVYQRAGKLKEARQEYDLVEYIGHLSTLNQVLANRELALFYADHNVKLPEAVELARKELTVRSDIYTWDALAWALYRNGELKDAGDAMDQALRLKTNDPILLFHAGMINRGLGRDSAAIGYLSQALKLNPHFHVLYDSVAARALAELTNDTRTSK